LGFFLPAPREETLAQGDILEAYDFFRPQGGTYKDVVRVPAAVISHSCDFTKFRTDEKKGREHLDRFPLLVAPVARSSNLRDGSMRGDAMRDRVPRYFYIPAETPLDDEDYFIDFWFIQPAAVFELLDIKRLASMTDTGQQHLQRGLDRFFSWEDRKKSLGPRP
jgi:hypothetical protein